MTLNLKGKSAKEIRELALVTTDAGALAQLAAHAKAKYDQFAAEGSAEWRLKGWVEAHNACVARASTPKRTVAAPAPAFATFTTEPAKGRKSKAKAPVAAASGDAELAALRDLLAARGLTVAGLREALSQA